LGQMTSEFNSDLFISFPSPFVVAVDTQIGMTAHSQRWGPATKARTTVQPQCMC